MFEGQTHWQERVFALVRVRCKVHAYFDPWLKWGGERVVPEIVSVLNHDLEQSKKLVRIALAPAYPDGKIPTEVLNMTVMLLNYHSWSSLHFQMGLSPSQIEKHLSNSICKLVDGQKK